VTAAWRVWTLAAITSLAAVGLRAVSEQDRVAPRAPLETLPFVLGGWNGRSQPPPDPATLAVLRADDYLFRAYSSPTGQSADLYVGFYQSQRQGDTIHSPLNCLPAAGWEIETIGRTHVGGAGTGPVEVNRSIVRQGFDRRLVLYWYQSHGRIVASEYWSRAYLVLDALRSHRSDGALVRIITPASSDDAGAERAAAEFAQVLVPALPRYLPN
jgi:EpsI family protein